jgi:hypothetical protein
MIVRHVGFSFAALCRIEAAAQQYMKERTSNSESIYPLLMSQMHRQDSTLPTVYEVFSAADGVGLR